MVIRVAILTQDLSGGGGVRTVALWLHDALRDSGHYDVDLHEVASSRSDVRSRRLADPRTLGRRSLRGKGLSADGGQIWGANIPEIEGMRYRPRRELDRELRKYDLVQVVAGGAAIGGITRGLDNPIALQVATRVRWERSASRQANGVLLGAWRRAMTAMVDRQEVTALRSAERVFVENSEMLDYVKDLGQAKVVKAIPGIDVDRFIPATSWERSGHILSVCRLGDRRKNLRQVVQAYSLMRGMVTNPPSLVLAGRGQLDQSVRKIIAVENLEKHVRVISNVTSRELPQLYSEASLYIQLSHEEGLGMSVMEAMASGIPIVSTNTAGSRESVIDGMTGYLLDVNGGERLPRDASEAMVRLLNSSGVEYARASRARAIAEFATPVCVERFTSAYQDLLGNPGSPRDY